VGDRCRRDHLRLVGWCLVPALGHGVRADRRRRIRVGNHGNLCRNSKFLGTRAYELSASLLVWARFRLCKWHRFDGSPPSNHAPPRLMSGTDSKLKVLWNWQTMGPYHFARMKALAERREISLSVVETCSVDDHGWRRKDTDVDGFQFITVSNDSNRLQAINRRA